ncbi:MAG: MarR family transcriptional regulator, partial [Candidatus Aenigmarchaeota archaeon]|nr:MarR family transcriptional regulator [Candidatus Aenigmarchaeota archaeon]
MRTIILALAILMLIPASHAATIQGTIYDWTTLEPVPKTIITVNSNPPQTYVSKDGTYSFELPFGEYTLSA